jgi:ceramide glucosyltransferase
VGGSLAATVRRRTGGRHGPMSATAQLWLGGFGTALAVAAMSYTIVAACARRWRPAPSPTRSAAVPPTTILMPLCGAEPCLYAGLRSFCELHSAQLQIVCGVRDPDDPALAVVRRLQGEFPRLELEIAVDPTQHGASGKVSNLINMLPLARHDYLVIADSDVRVSGDYLERVVTPLLDEGVGIVTCLYYGRPRGGLWSLLGSMFVNEWFMPSVRIAAWCGSRSFAFGATIALRRAVLNRVGGFPAIVDHLADDSRLGELTRRAGLRTVLCDAEVETSIDEPTLADLVRHELRWLRTIRTVQPLGYALSGLTFGLPVSLLGGLLTGGSRATLIMLAITAAARFMVDSVPRRIRSFLAQLWLVALNDLVVFSLWCWGFATRRVQWRQVRYGVARDGTAHPIP